jgi:hypothetical protein
MFIEMVQFYLHIAIDPNHLSKDFRFQQAAFVEYVQSVTEPTESSIIRDLNQFQVRNVTVEPVSE